jgi:hypothetical protein
MLLTSLKTAAILPAVMVVLSGSGAFAQPADRPAAASKLDLTPKNFAKLHELIRPQADEWRHLRVDWFTDVTAAQKKAAAEDKPIIFLRGAGAGYNDPLGTC